MHPSLGRLARNRRLMVALQLLAVVVLLGALAFGVRDVWPDAAPLLRRADPIDLAAALLVLAAYYLLFVLGWVWILRLLGVRLPYRLAVQAEMLSMLAKYVPGGVWTPAARVVAVRRFGLTDTPLILASIALEAGLSAVAGVIVLLASLPLVGVADAPIALLVAFAAVVAVLVHPRVFQPLTRRLLRPFGPVDVPVLRYRAMLGVLGFYALTWPLGGVVVFFLLRSVGGDPDPSAIPYLGGATAVGAIVAVLAVFAPSGLGVREATVYGLILAVSTEAAALSATILNRLAITVVEAALLALAALAWRTKLGRAKGRRAERVPDAA